MNAEYEILNAFDWPWFRTYPCKLKTADSLSNYDFYSYRLLRCIHQPSALSFRFLRSAIF